MANHPNNVLVMQSGGCTPVLNSSLYGIMSEASFGTHFGSVYGASHGLEGVLSGQIANLGDTGPDEWQRISRTPGAALGSSRRMLRPDDTATIAAALERLGIGYWFIIGGNDSAETGRSLGSRLHEYGVDIAIVNVPKTIDNDLVEMDHCPGYGSAARFVALATMGAGRDAEAMGRAAPITIIEVMGRDAGWLAASAALVKREERDAPHLICLPEVPIDGETFVTHVEAAYAKHGFAVAVVAENTKQPDGKPLGDLDEPLWVDDFGHAYYDGPARYLSGLVSKHLKVRTRYEKPGTIQRSLAECLSETDVAEAEQAGRAAVRYAREGHSGVIVTLQRGGGEAYSCEYGMAPLEAVASRVRVMPEEYIDRERFFVTEPFVKYALPLIGRELPRFGRVAWGGLQP
jgi:6-phosphofructokinase 1